MPQPVTTAELLLAQVVDLLTEVRDLLQQAPAEQPPEQPAPKAASRAPRKHTTKKS